LLASETRKGVIKERGGGRSPHHRTVQKGRGTSFNPMQEKKKEASLLALGKEGLRFKKEKQGSFLCSKKKKGEGDLWLPR